MQIMDGKPVVLTPITAGTDDYRFYLCLYPKSLVSLTIVHCFIMDVSNVSRMQKKTGIYVHSYVLISTSQF
jgi:hypothetical protein